MNPITVRKMLGAAAMLASASLVLAKPVLAEPEAPVAVKTEGLPSPLRARVQEKAAQGQTALIHYVNRTRMMGYQIRAEDVVAARDGAKQIAKEVAKEAVAMK